MESRNRENASSGVSGVCDFFAKLSKTSERFLEDFWRESLSCLSIDPNECSEVLSQNVPTKLDKSASLVGRQKSTKKRPNRSTLLLKEHPEDSTRIDSRLPSVPPQRKKTRSSKKRRIASNASKVLGLLVALLGLLMVPLIRPQLVLKGLGRFSRSSL